MGRAKNKKRQKPKKRNYNSMIAENKEKFSQKENTEDIIKRHHKKKAKLPKNNDNSPDENYFFNFPFQIDKTNVPPNDVIKKNSSNRKANLPLYSILSNSYTENKEKNDLKNIKFKENNFMTDEIYKDGNCFYRAISSFFCGTEEYHLFFRNLIYDYIMSDYDNILISFPYVYFNGKTIDIDE